jgi:hypothetical protein
MIKKVMISLVVISCIVLCIGSNAKSKSQKKGPPDLTGIWKLDKSKGHYNRLSGPKTDTDADLILTISHVEPEIKVIRKLIREGQERILQELIYYSDGKGETGYALVAPLEGKSKSKWDGNKLMTKFTARGKEIYEVIQEWSLSADGNTLTQTEKARLTSVVSDSSLEIKSVARNEMSVTESKMVFHRIP